MATFVYVLLFLAMAGNSSATWCVCKQGQDKVLQKTLDYACGAGADCNPLHNGGPCYNPDTVKDHCDYAVNSFFQKKGQAAGTCDFAGTATLATSDPSKSGCSFPSSASSSTTTTSNGINGTPSSGNTGGTNGMPSNGNSPFVTTPTGSSILGGANNGLGPSGTSIEDESSARNLLQKANLFFSFCTSILVSTLMFWWRA
ncbi:hypothetical protein Leryth_001323 [Lithospermum erythrorhizon]|nr:hypothetical protein Leryth_001323 [Lithospermum erythrorhizon]